MAAAGVVPGQKEKSSGDANAGRAARHPQRGTHPRGGYLSWQWPRPGAYSLLNRNARAPSVPVVVVVGGTRSHARHARGLGRSLGLGFPKAALGFGSSSALRCQCAVLSEVALSSPSRVIFLSPHQAKAQGSQRPTAPIQESRSQNSTDPATAFSCEQASFSLFDATIRWTFV